MNFATYAVLQTKGRQHHESPPIGRTEFQRDRDRIIHANAFRRLEYKTQVFVNHEGDLFRTRLTHSLEVAQIARSVARNLRVNEDLVEAISLAHDLGHTPFGHAGQDALNVCMREVGGGGFEHNLQSLRVVDLLEERYGAFDGLNLCFETSEGILKHCSLDNARRLGAVGERFIQRLRPSLEAQIANLSDEIAYNNHDIDDGLRSGLIQLEQIREVPIFNEHFEKVQARYPGQKERRQILETIRSMIHVLITDLSTTTQTAIDKHQIRTLDDVRQAPAVVNFSPEIRHQADEMKKFLREKLYRHYRVNRMMKKCQRIIKELFYAFSESPNLLPDSVQARLEKESCRAIADYIAGMTDRYALREHRRLFMIGLEEEQF